MMRAAPSDWFPLDHMLCLSCDALSCYRKSGLSLVWFKYGWRLPFCTLLNLLLAVICAPWVVFCVLLMGLSLVFIVIQKEPNFCIGSRCRTRKKEERTYYWEEMTNFVGIGCVQICKVKDFVVVHLWNVTMKTVFFAFWRSSVRTTEAGWECIRTVFEKGLKVFINFYFIFTKAHFSGVFRDTCCLWLSFTETWWCSVDY